MAEPIEWLRVLIDNHKSFEYIIITVVAAVGGEVVLFSLGFLAAQDVISISSAVTFGFLGAFTPNILWFLLGKTFVLQKMISHRYANVTINSVMQAVHRISRDNQLAALAIIKFLVGTPILLVMYSAKTNLSFKKFLLYESVAIFLSVVVLASLGFISGLGFIYLTEISTNLYGAMGFILLIIILITTAQIQFEKRFTENLSENKEVE